MLFHELNQGIHLKLLCCGLVVGFLGCTTEDDDVPSAGECVSEYVSGLEGENSSSLSCLSSCFERDNSDYYDCMWDCEGKFEDRSRDVLFECLSQSQPECIDAYISCKNNCDPDALEDCIDACDVDDETCEQGCHSEHDECLGACSNQYDNCAGGEAVFVCSLGADQDKADCKENCGNANVLQGEILDVDKCVECVTDCYDNSFEAFNGCF